MHYYQFHIGDYAAHTRHLSLIEDLAYRRLLDLYYMTEKPIFTETAARLIGMREYGQEVLCVLVEFFTETDEGFINKRADHEIASYKAMSVGGKKGAKKRWDNERNREAMPPLSPSDSAPSQPLIATKNHEPITNISTDVDIKEKRAPRFDAAASLSSLGVDSQVAADWLQHRKAKKAAVTQTVIDGVAKEAAKARISLSDALALSCQRGWVGFKADWAFDTNGSKSQHQIVQEAQTKAIFGDTGFLIGEKVIAGEVVQ